MPAAVARLHSRARAVPGPSGGIHGVLVPYDHRLYRYTGVEGAGLEGDEAGSVGAGALWKHHHLVEIQELIIVLREFFKQIISHSTTSIQRYSRSL